MSFMDNSLAFSTSWSSAQTVTATADSTNVIDVAGVGSGTVPAMTPSVLGADIGAGDGEARPTLYVAVSAVNGSPSSNTLTITLKAAPDNGSGSAGTYKTLYSSAAVTESTLVVGDYLIVPVPATLFDWPSASLPRFYKLTYTAGGGNLAGIGLLAGIMLNPPSSMLAGNYPNNFTVV